MRELSHEKRKLSKRWVIHRLPYIEAPLAGAWIEIKIYNAVVNTLAEAPLAGAWIDISVHGEKTLSHQGSPSRRGVNWNFRRKHGFNNRKRSPSRRGVNWNISILWHIAFQFRSPSRRGVNWNKIIEVIILCNLEAPLAGAWIEISRYRCRRSWFSEAPLAGAWIEMLKSCEIFRISNRSPSRRGVNWNNLCPSFILFNIAKPLSQGRELKFICSQSDKIHHNEAPLAGAWIEMLNTFTVCIGISRSPSRRGVNWNLFNYSCHIHLIRSPSRRGVNWNSEADGGLDITYEAPLAGAWIEMEYTVMWTGITTKPLSQGRELK